MSYVVLAGRRREWGREVRLRLGYCRRRGGGESKGEGEREREKELNHGSATVGGGS